MKKLLLTLLTISTLSINLIAQEPESAGPVKDGPDFTQVLQSNTIELMSWVKQTAQKTENFAAEQTPLFIQEYVSWTFWSNLVTCTFIFVSYGCLLTGFIVSLRKTKWEGDFTFNAGVCIAFALALVVTIPGLFIHGTPALQNCIKAKVAPRVLIVEKISELIIKK